MQNPDGSIVKGTPGKLVPLESLRSYGDDHPPLTIRLTYSSHQLKTAADQAKQGKQAIQAKLKSTGS
jgi:hypothetical protein